MQPGGLLLIWACRSVPSSGAWSSTLSRLPPLYAGSYSGLFKSTDAGGTWTAVNMGLPDGLDGEDHALAIDPLTPTTVYAGTDAGVFDIEQVAVVPCAGDCDNDQAVTVDELLTLASIAPGNAQPSACPDGIPSVSEVNITLIIQAVNNALNGCA